MDESQELGSMYEYLAKVILLGPSGSGKSCLLHRFTHNEFRSLSSQTIGVEFASKIIRVGDSSVRGGGRAKRIKLQLWDTAGTERFRSVSRSYYRGAAGAILVYDVASLRSFEQLPTFLSDARALASPRLTLLLAGNKSDLADPTSQQKQAMGGGGRTQTIHMNGSAHSQRHNRDDDNASIPTPTASSASSRHSYMSQNEASTPSSVKSGQSSRSRADSLLLQTPTALPATTTQFGREVPPHLVSTWSSRNHIPAVLEVSALSGENVEAVFYKLAAMILTKIELGEIDPDDPSSGIQYGDGGLGMDDAGSITTDGGTIRRRKGGGKAKPGGILSLGEWEDVFRRPAGRGGRCC
jgi:Ras-related protein Rab-4B